MRRSVLNCALWRPTTPYDARRAAVAAPLPVEDGGPAPPALQGMAACFLPLPVATGLPVHVNGYFELSSNRRDIWCATWSLADNLYPVTIHEWR